ncbi:MAG: ParB/RepB/Spo0J family partition protein [Galactobacter sp.]
MSSTSAASSPSAATPAQQEHVSPQVASADGLIAVPGTSFAEIDTNQIHPNRKQPRQVFDEDELDELVTSIKEVGLLQPIVVRSSHEPAGPKYELVMGERRWRATQAAGLTRIPAIIRETEDGDLLRDALLENLHRSQLNPLEEAAAYQQLMDEFACTQDELSSRIGRSRPQISNTIRLLRLPALVQRRVAAGVLSAGHARALLTVEDAEALEKLAQRVVNEGLSVRATEEAASLLRGETPQSKHRRRQEPQRHERLDHLASSLQDRLDTNVKITLGARKGKVQIEFASVDDLDRIMNLIGQDDAR